MRIYMHVHTDILHLRVRCVRVYVRIRRVGSAVATWMTGRGRVVASYANAGIYRVFVVSTLLAKLASADLLDEMHG